MTVRNQPSERETGNPGRVVLDEIERSENLPAVITAEQALAAVLCVLEQALGGSGAERLERGLPTSIRELGARCAQHVRQAPEQLHVGEFLRRVGEHVDLDRTPALELTRTVFYAMHRLMTVGEVEEIAGQLAEDVQRIWRDCDTRGPSNQASRPA